MADDGSGADITIPSFLIFKTDADAVKKELMAETPVEIEMSWPIPSPDDRVEYSLWTTPTDNASKNFLMEFLPIAKGLGDKAYFTPHMYIYDGIKANCVGNDGENFCYNLCTNNGRYCSTDPTGDLDEGISGADVVKESLRRICIWKLYGESDGVGESWWEYVIKFENRCNNSKDFMNDKCVRACYDKASVNEDLVHKCMEDSGGLEGDSANSFLDYAIASQAERGVVVLPTTFVNTVALRGSLSVSNVFTAICGGYAAGSAPEICDTCIGCGDPSACADTGECTAHHQPDGLENTIVVEEEPDFFRDQPGDDMDTMPIGDVSGGQLDMLLGLAEAFGDMEICGVNLGELANTAATAVVQSSTGQVPNGANHVWFELDEICSPVDEAKFVGAMKEFQSCSKWDIKEIIETLPSAMVGTAMRCAALVLTSDGSDLSDEVMEGCVVALFGDNPLGNAIKRVFFQPDVNCPCFQSFSDSVPECEMDVWPIPLMGSWLKKSTCLFVELGCGFFDTFCEGELAALNHCLPEAGNDDTACAAITECPEAEDSLLLSAPSALLGIPLPDACIRVYKEQESSSFVGADLIERYQEFVGNCGAGVQFWEINDWSSGQVPLPAEDVSESPIEKQESPEETAEEAMGEAPVESDQTDTIVQAMVVPDPGVRGYESGGSTKSSSGFISGLATGAFLVAAFSAFLIYYLQKNKRDRINDAARGEYAAIELT